MGGKFERNIKTTRKRKDGKTGKTSKKGNGRKQLYRAMRGKDDGGGGGGGWKPEGRGPLSSGLEEGVLPQDDELSLFSAELSPPSKSSTPPRPRSPRRDGGGSSSDTDDELFSPMALKKLASLGNNRKRARTTLQMGKEQGNNNNSGKGGKQHANNIHTLGSSSERLAVRAEGKRRKCSKGLRFNQLEVVKQRTWKQSKL